MSTNKFQYWPSNGQLGSTTFTMPTNAEDWPSGDALIGNFVYSEGKLVDFIDIKGLTPNTSKSTTIPYDYVNIELPFTEDVMTINRGPRNKYLIIKFNDKDVEEGGNVIVTLKYKGCKTVDDVKAVDHDYLTNDIVDGVWKEGLSDLENGDWMLAWNENITSFSSDLSSLTNGDHMIAYCENLSEFYADLPKLTDGEGMFCITNLSSFNGNLPSLRDGTYMFYNCNNLTSFNGNLPSLTNGYSMFLYCYQLASFNGNLYSLTNGEYMFYYCNNLKSFSSDLSSLEYGYDMFNGCELNASSIKNIIDTINTHSGNLSLGIGCNNTTEDKDLFAQEVGYSDMTSLLAALQAKGWTVYTQFNGRPTTTYSLRRPSEDTLPVFVKLEEVEEHADYTSLDDSKKYRLNWFHETTGSTEGYTQFSSLEEAIEYFNIKPVER